MRPTIRVQSAPIDVAAEVAAALDGDGRAGAAVTFAGLCRDEGGRLAALELEHYPGMAEAEFTRIAERAAQRWTLLSATILHRHGLVRPGETIVFVATSGAHRAEAFAAAEFLMDFLKTRAPFWKREHLADGTVGPWVEARHADDEAAERWG